MNWRTMWRVTVWPRLKPTLEYFFVIVAVLVAAAFIFLFVGTSKVNERGIWGVNFSAKHTKNLGLDWKETYLAMLNDLGAKHIKLAAHWDYIEPRQEQFDWIDMDWMISEAEKHGAKLVPVIGMKTPRWPECHIPDWAKSFDQGSLEYRISHYVETFVNRYKNSPAVDFWQVENEPFFPFGDCPFWMSKETLQNEVDMVHRLDPGRKVMITDTGEFSFWFGAAKIGDTVGSTLYRKVWFKQLSRYWTYPFPPVYYSRRAWLVEKIFGKNVIDAELQAEPWGPVLYYDLPLSEQMKTMPIEQFRSNIEYARRTKFSQHYFWGAEWWYWMKTKQNDPAYWEEAKKVFATSD